MSVGDRVEVFKSFDFEGFRGMKEEYWREVRKEKRFERVDKKRNGFEEFWNRCEEVNCDRRGMSVGNDRVLEFEEFFRIMKYFGSDESLELRETCAKLLAEYSKGRIPFEYLERFEVVEGYERVLGDAEISEESLGCYLVSIGNFSFGDERFVSRMKKVVSRLIEISMECSDFVLDKIYYAVSGIAFWDTHVIQNELGEFLVEGLSLSCISFETMKVLLLCISKRCKELKFTNEALEKLTSLVVNEIKDLDYLAMEVIGKVLSYFDPDGIMDFGVLEEMSKGLFGKFKKDVIRVFFNLLWNSQVFWRFAKESKVLETVLGIILVESQEVVLIGLFFLIKCSEDWELRRMAVELGAVACVCILLGGRLVEVIDKSLDLLYSLRQSEKWSEELIKYQGFILLESLFYHKNTTISKKSEALYSMLLNPVMA